MLVPAMQSTGTRSCSSTAITPTWAAPRAPPPESTRQTLGRAGEPAPGEDAWASTVGGVPASTAAASAAKVDRIERRRKRFMASCSGAVPVLPAFQAHRG